MASVNERKKVLDKHGTPGRLAEQHRISRRPSYTPKDGPYVNRSRKGWIYEAGGSAIRGV